MAGWIILFAAVCILFAATQFVFLPKIVTTLRYGAVKPRGRGRRIIKEVKGESIVYDAAPDVSHVIPQYLLSERNGEKLLVCKLDESVRSVDYDVALFDKNGKVFKVLNVREEVGRAGYAREIALPRKTEYVSLYLNAADGVCRGVGAPAGKIPKRHVVLYIAVFLAAVFLSVWLLRICIANLFGGLYGESFLHDSSQNAVVAVMWLAVTFLDVLFALIMFKVKNRTKKRRKSRAGN